MIALRSSRPSYIRVLHQAAPDVATRVTRSPATTPRSRKASTASLAFLALCGDRCMSSKRMTKVRPGSRASGRTGFVAIRGGGVGSGEACLPGPRLISSKLLIERASPSSKMVKSSCVRPGTGRPSLSSTTTSTVTRSTCAPLMRRTGPCGPFAGGAWSWPEIAGKARAVASTPMHPDRTDTLRLRVRSIVGTLVMAPPRNRPVERPARLHWAR